MYKNIYNIHYKYIILLCDYTTDNFLTNNLNFSITKIQIHYCKIEYLWYVCVSSVK